MSKTRVDKKNPETSKAALEEKNPGDAKQVDKKNLLILALLATATFTLGLARNNYAYTYYSAAAQAGTKSWRSFFFASIDSGNFMSVDKPPYSVWFSSLSARILGLSPFSILLPHALAGVACVCILYITIRKTFNSKTAFLSSFFFLITPISSVVFRYNIVDSFLLLFIMLSIYYFLKSLQEPRVIWLLISGVFIGCAFNTKMTQGLIILPIFVVMYIYNAKPPLIKRFVYSAAMIAVTVLSSLWWVVITGLTPAGSRPYVGSTAHNSIWEMVLIHNGFGRFFGSNWKQPTGNGTGIAFGGETGFFRMFNTGFGPNFVWLFFTGTVGTFVAIWAYKKSRNLIQIKNQIGVWFFLVLVNGTIFSFTKGTIHPYYTLIFAPALASLTAIGLSPLWTEKITGKTKHTVRIWMISAAFLSIVVFLPTYIFNGKNSLKTNSSDSDFLSAIKAILPIAQYILYVVVGVSLIAFIVASILQNLKYEKIAFRSVFVCLLLIPFSMTVANISIVQYGFIPTTQPIPKDISKITQPNTGIPDDFKEFLLVNHQGEKWIAATSSAIASAPIQLSTGNPVIALGGFSASDDPMSLSDFQKLVYAGKVRFFIIDNKQSKSFNDCLPAQLLRRSTSGESTRACPSSSQDNVKSSAAIEQWVLKHDQVKSFNSGQWEVYDLRTK